MRPTVSEERAHAIAGELDAWRLPPEERDAFESRLATPWRRNSVWLTLAFFLLGAFAVSALSLVVHLLRLPEAMTGVVAIVAAEILIRRFRFYGFGVESALFIGGLVALIFSLPSSGKPEAALVIAAAFALAAWRMQNALYGCAAVLSVAGYLAWKLDAAAPAIWFGFAIALAGAVAKTRLWRRPWLEHFLSVVAVMSTVVAGALWEFENPPGLAPRVIVYLLLAMTFGLAAVKLRDHALLFACGGAVACAGYALRNVTRLPQEVKLIAAGFALLALAAVLSRILRGRTRGIVATPAQLTPVDGVVQLGGTLAVGSALHQQPETAEPGSSGGGGGFGGAGATGGF
jgi:hypothetical protein